MAYGIKMKQKKEKGIDYQVYTLEGIWTLNEEGVSEMENGKLDKGCLEYQLLIQIPFPISSIEMEEIAQKKKIDYAKDLTLFQMEEMDVVQVLLKGSFDDEPKSFQKLDLFLTKNHLEKKMGYHMESYLNDARKVKEENKQTILSFFIKK